MVKSKKEKNIERKFEMGDSGINGMVSMARIKKANGLGGIYMGRSPSSYRNASKSTRYKE